MSNYDIVEDEFLHKNIEHIANRSLQNDKETKSNARENCMCIKKKDLNLFQLKNV